MRLVFTLFLGFLFIQNNFSQQPPISPQQAGQELSKKGITDEEFKARMLQKGYDLENIKPEQVPQLEQVIEETVNELEKEKTAENNAVSGEELEMQATEAVEKAADNQAQKATDEIEEAVREGASLEEAISEELSEEAKNGQSAAKIYGQHIFRNQSLEVYRSAKDIKPPKTYVLGPGDELVVSIFGISQAEFSFTINENGYIQPSRMPRIYLKGVTLEKAEKLIQQRFSQFYVFAPEQFTLTVNTARTISVNIFGEVENFGSFTISAINTAFNALVAAGGPTDIGTVRNIKLIRGRETKEIDVYEFLFDPTVQFDFFLQNNDIIHVPTSEKLVSILGAVKRPFKYELIEGENLNALIRFAGGLEVDAYTENLQVTRIINNQRVIIDINLSDLEEKNGDFELKNGDIISVSKIPERLENFVEIKGAIEFPSQYELLSGMRVSSLIQKGVLKEDARIDIAFLLRENTDGTIEVKKLNLNNILQNSESEENILLQKADKLTVFSQTQFVDNYSIFVTGAVRSPIEYPFDPAKSITVEDAITLAGGLRPDAADFAYIIRENIENPKEKQYFRIDLNASANIPNSAVNTKLLPRDRVEIMSKSAFTDIYSVEVNGAVRNPGKFQFDETLTLKDVLTMAGGLKLEAASNKIEIFRVVMNENQPTQTIVATLEVNENLNILSGNPVTLEPFDLIVVRTVPSFELQKTVKIEGEVLYPGVYSLINENEKLVDVIRRAGGLTGEAFPEGARLFRAEGSVGDVILELEKAIENDESRFNYVLKNGDEIVVPKNKDLVTINIEATLAKELYPNKFLESGKISVAYKKGKRAEWYIDEYAAGINTSQKGRRRYITVEYPNGKINKVTGLVFTPKVKKGSIINVGKKPEKPPKPPKPDKEPVDWGKVIGDTLALATSAITIIVLANRL